MVQEIDIQKYASGTLNKVMDIVIEEAPLQVFSCKQSGLPEPHFITMRTPGHDTELAAGFFYNENIIQALDEVSDLKSNDHGVTVRLSDANETDLIARNFYTNSSCGVCGKSTEDELYKGLSKVDDYQGIAPSIIEKLYRYMSVKQTAFNATGGCHSAAVFRPDGEAVVLREDVGRHNAVDKCSGYMLLNDLFKRAPYILCLSGRCCFELIQKAIRMHCSTVISIGAPTTMAIDTARKYGLTLIGFFNNDRFNLYAGKLAA